MLKIEQASKAFGKQVIFDKIDLMIKDPGLYALVGHSGCGKSTLLNIIAGYDKFDQGVMTIDESVMTIFQNYELIQELNVYDNIFLEREKEEKDDELLKQLGIDSLLDQYPKELSGGQQQRVGIARALLTQPKIICCDEPTESLDVNNKEIVMRILKQYSKNHIVLMATHQMDTVENYADTILKIEDHKIVVDHVYQSDAQLDQSKERDVKPSSVKNLMKKIIHKQNGMFLTIFMVLLLVAETSSILKQHLFYIPTSTNALNANMVYLDATQNKLEDLMVSGAQPIARFNKSMNFNGKQEIVYIYPITGELEAFSITGSKPMNNQVLINQNMAENIYHNDYNHQSLSLPIQFSDQKVEISFEIVGVIHEEDSKENSLYYDKNWLDAYLSNMKNAYGGSLKGVLDAQTDLFQKRVAYEEIPSFIEEMKMKDSSIKVTSPLYDQRLSLQEDSKLYVLLFTILTWIILILLTVATYSLTQKEARSHKKSFLILASQKVSVEQIKKDYFTQKFVPIFVFSLVDIVCLLVLKNLLPHLTILWLVVMVVFEIIFYAICIKLSLQNVKQENISAMLKELNEIS